VIDCALPLPVNRRALIHACAILVPLAVQITSRSVTVAVLCAIAAIYTLAEMTRLRGRYVPFLSKFTLSMSRSNERDHFVTAPVLLTAGIILVLLLFPRNIAYASIVIVGAGDPIAAYVGGRYGRRYVGRKSWEGYVAGSCSAFVLTLVLVSPIIGIIGSVVGMSLELIGGSEDNLIIPIGSGLVMALAAALLSNSHIGI
jgi:dolichol kinase